MRPSKAPRPIFSPPLRPLDRAIEWLCALLLLGLWALLAVYYPDLPEQIPTHFNALGEPDSYGQKSALLSLPITATALYLLLSVLNRFPWAFNYPVSITPENAQQQYTHATRMLRQVKLAVVLLLGYICLATVQAAGRTGEGLGSWFLPAGLVIVFLPLCLYFFRARRVH